jgi:two-component system response regulator
MVAPFRPLVLEETDSTRSALPGCGSSDIRAAAPFPLHHQSEEISKMYDDVDILMVEDNPNDEMLALHAFKRNKIANKVYVVRDGAEALEFIFCTGAYAERTVENPKVILLDLKLPLVDGIEVLRQVRRHPRTQTVPVVMLTSSSEERDVVETYKLGVNSYIVKPVDFEQFNEVARHLGYYWLLLNRQPAAVSGSPPPMTSTLVSSGP